LLIFEYLKYVVALARLHVIPANDSPWMAAAGS